MTDNLTMIILTRDACTRMSSFDLPVWFENWTVLRISTSKPSVCKGNTAALLPARRLIRQLLSLAAASLFPYHNSPRPISQ